MEVNFCNGAFVHRLYTDSGHPEFVAVCQYALDAEMFARSKLAEDAARQWFDCFYTVTDARTGQMQTYRHAAAPSSGDQSK